MLNWCQMDHVIRVAAAMMDLTNKWTYKLYNLIHYSDHIVMATSVITFLHVWTCCSSI